MVHNQGARLSGDQEAEGMYCRNCGAILPDDARFCQECGFKSEQSSEVRRCPRCGKPIPDGSLFCPSCGRDPQQESEEPYNREGRRITNRVNILLAMILSALIPGVGQMYVGFVKRGAIILIVSVLVLIASLFLIFLPILVYWIWNIYDAYARADETNRLWDSSRRCPPHVPANCF